MLKTKQQDQLLLVHLSGDIDHHTARDLRMEIDRQVTLHKPRCLHLDFGAVSFMDSSGIGLVMGRYKLMQSMDGKVKVVNLPGHIKKVMTLAGLDKLAVLE